MTESCRSNQTSKIAHPFYALLIILILASVLANLIPSGKYERQVVNGRTIVIADSYHQVEKQYVGVPTFFLSFYHGFKNASGLMALIFFAGGAFGVINRIGLMEAAIKTLAQKLRNTSFYLISFILMLVIGTQVAFTSMWELSVVIIPMIVPLVLALGYDSVTGACIVIFSACAGFGAAMTNPLFTAIAHKLAELPIYSALWFRGISFISMLLLCYAFLMRYATKVKNDPSKGLLADMDSRFSPMNNHIAPFTPALIRAGFTFIAVFAFLLYGTVALGFDFPEITACFAAMGLLTGLVHGSSPNEICEMMGDGMKDLFFGGMVMLFARAVLYVMETAMIVDTVIAFLAQFVVGHSPTITAILLLYMQTIINFFIPSGSGQAAITIPIVIPLADMGGVTRQVACLASQFGDGFSNFIYPTNGSLIAILMVAGIPYRKWFKLFLPLFLMIMLLSTLIVAVGVAINLGPF
ncbi:MAG: TIGR00366 family protein [Fretibacterium sp.]|nr:TIGR00366 family protein [Fretibacterium sp.]